MANGISQFGLNANFGVRTFGGFGLPPAGVPIEQFANSPLQLTQLTQLLSGVISALSQLQAAYGGMLRGPGKIPRQPPRFPGQTTFPGQPTQPGNGIPQTDPRFANWAQQVQNNNSRTVSNAARTDISQLTDDGRAVLHLWGRQITAGGKQDGSIYFNVLNDSTGAFTPAEHQLVQRLYNQEMQQYGGITGKALDGNFFNLMGQMTGEDLSSKYANSPIHFSNGQPVSLSTQALQNNGLGDFANAVLRLWGHDRLDDGKNDGSILQFTLQNPNAFDKDVDKNIVQSLAAADLAADGKIDGNSLARAFSQTLDQVYLGGPGGSVQSTLAQVGINQTQVGGFLERLKSMPMVGIPPGVDITNIANIGKCPMLGQSINSGQTQTIR